MHLRFILILFGTMLFIACDDTPEEIPKLDGYYSLVSISCECSPFNLVSNQQQCKIGLDKKTLSVRTFGEEINHLFLKENEYEISIVNNAIEIDGKTYGFTMSENAISFDTGIGTGIADLPVYRYTKE